MSKPNKLPLDLPPIQDAINEANAQFDRELTQSIKTIEERRKERLDAINKSRLVYPALHELVGERLRITFWAQNCQATIDLGEKPTTKAGLAEFNETLIQLRDILGNLKEADKNVPDDCRTKVRICLRSEEHPEIAVKFITKLPKGAKCRIVRTRHKAWTSTSVVCNI